MDPYSHSPKELYLKLNYIVLYHSEHNLYTLIYFLKYFFDLFDIKNLSYNLGFIPYSNYCEEKVFFILFTQNFLIYLELLKIHSIACFGLLVLKALVLLRPLISNHNHAPVNIKAPRSEKGADHHTPAKPQ